MESSFTDYVRPSWHQKAACRGKPIGWFFPDVGESTEKAKLICSGCSVTTECLEQATDGAEHGIWAATSPKARQKLRNAA